MPGTIDDEFLQQEAILLSSFDQFEVTTTQQAKQLGKTHAEQLEYAVSQRATILTHNRTDFEVLAREYFEQERMHYGIIVAVRNPYQEIVRRLLAILNNTTADEMEHQILYI